MRGLKHRKPIYGFAINDADYSVYTTKKGKQSICPYYKVWMMMLARCYKQTQASNYKNCSVDPDWWYFSTFKKWMEKQNWQNNHLDKDLLKKGNRIYSEKNCLFVSRKINNLIHIQKRRSKLPTGVSFDKFSSKFIATVCIKGKNKKLGKFLKMTEAKQAFIKAKAQIVYDVAIQQSDAKTQKYLLKISKEIAANNYY